MDNQTIRFIALDMDGTILRSDYSISPEVSRALADCRRRGYKIIISTGRVYSSARKHVDSIGGADGYVCSNGADVYDGDGKSIRSLHMDARLSKRIVEISRRFDSHFHAFIGEDWFYEKERSYTRFYFGRSGLAGKQVNFDAFSSPGFAKCLFIDEHEKLAPIEAAMRAELADEVQLMYSAPFMLEVVIRGVNKAEGLRACVNGLGGTLEQTIAFGDADNDEEMLLAAGIGVAMGNAHEGLKAKADFVAPSIDEDGVAVFLRGFLPKA